MEAYQIAYQNESGDFVLVETFEAESDAEANAYVSECYAADQEWYVWRMKMTEQEKREIDAMSYEDLLRACRFASAGDPRFQGDRGEYWAERMRQLREAGADHVGASKRIGLGD